MAYIGYTRVTADGPVGTSGRSVAVYSVFLDSGSGGAGDFALKNGTSTAGTTVYSFAGSGANALQLFEIAGGAGVVFPDGCFIDVGSNVDAVTVAYQEYGL